jgi:hypothetical protein
MMIQADALQGRPEGVGPASVSVSRRYSSQRTDGVSMRSGMMGTSFRQGMAGGPQPVAAMPQLQLYNDSLGIQIVGINGAIIGRKQGPYVHFFKQQAYVSGVHAQLSYRPDIGWCISDRNSSNGTKLNDHRLQPDIDMSLKNGDIVSIANVVLKVIIN